jgi:hypothetical protein
VGGLNEESRMCTRLHAADAVAGGPRIKRNVSGEAAKFFRIVEKRGSWDNMSAVEAAIIVGWDGGPWCGDWRRLGDGLDVIKIQV